LSEKRLLIIGAGGHGRVVADAADASGKWSEIAFVDDKYPKMSASGDWPVIGRLSSMEGLQKYWGFVMVAIGDNRLRLKLQQDASKVGFSIACIIHPSAQIAKQVKIGEGSVVFANAVVNFGSSLGRSVIINTAATIDHDGVIGDGAHISPGVHLAGDVRIGEYAWVGVGATVINGINIGSGATVGAGAAVIRDVSAGQMVVGVPAMAISE